MFFLFSRTFSPETSKLETAAHVAVFYFTSQIGKNLAKTGDVWYNIMQGNRGY